MTQCWTFRPGHINSSEPCLSRQVSIRAKHLILSLKNLDNVTPKLSNPSGWKHSFTPEVRGFPKYHTWSQGSQVRGLQGSPAPAPPQTGACTTSMQVSNPSTKGMTSTSPCSTADCPITGCLLPSPLNIITLAFTEPCYKERMIAWVCLAISSSMSLHEMPFQTRAYGMLYSPRAGTWVFLVMSIMNQLSPSPFTLWLSGISGRNLELN